MTQTKSDVRPVAVFDSGFGGLTVLHDLYRLMPGEDYIYFGDSANAPYGHKSQEVIRKIALNNARRLAERGAKAIVVACGTATSAALGYLKKSFPELIVTGTDPSVERPALELDHPDVLVMATNYTIRGERLHSAVERMKDKAEYHLLSAQMIVKYVEGGEYDGCVSPAFHYYLEEILETYGIHGHQHIDAVVHGCTHFPFVQQAIQEVLGYPVHFYEAGVEVAETAKRLMEDAGVRNLRPEGGHIEFLNSREDHIETEKRLFEALNK